MGMAKTLAFRLAFSGGLRAGANVGDVNRQSDAVTASTLWGGLGCCAALLAEKETVCRLVTKSRLSSLLWIDGDSPLFPAPVFVPPPDLDLQKAKNLKKHRWITLEELNNLVGRGETPQRTPSQPFVEEALTSTSVDRSSQAALPYPRRRIRPAAGCDGLLIAQLPDGLEELFRSALALLGDSGLGGERSHGWGLFESHPFDLEKTSLLQALTGNGRHYLNLGAFLPHDDEIQRIEGMALPYGYALWKLRGYVGTSDTLKPTVTCLAHGSLLPFRPQGRTETILQAEGHPVVFNGCPPALALA